MNRGISHRYSIKKRRELRRHRWEQLCKGCGVCCYEKKLSFTVGYYTDFSSPCEYLDEETRLCAVYEKRFSVCKACKKMTILHALFSDFLPADCGYVEKFRIWRRFSRRFRARQKRHSSR